MYVSARGFQGMYICTNSDILPRADFIAELLLFKTKQLFLMLIVALPARDWAPWANPFPASFKRREAEDVLNTLVAVAEDKARIHQRKVARSSVDAEILPVEKIVGKLHMVHCGVKKDPTSIKQVLRECLQSRVREDMVSSPWRKNRWLDRNVTDGRTSSELISYAVVLGNTDALWLTSTGRLDCYFFYYRFGSTTITSVAEDCLITSLVFSSVDSSRLHANDIRRLVESAYSAPLPNEQYETSRHRTKMIERQILSALNNAPRHRSAPKVLAPNAEVLKSATSCFGRKSVEFAMSRHIVSNFRQEKRTTALQIRDNRKPKQSHCLIVGLRHAHLVSLLGNEEHQEIAGDAGRTRTSHSRVSSPSTAFLIRSNAMAVLTPEGTPSPAERADDTPANDDVRHTTESEALPESDRLTITFKDMQGYELVFKLKGTTKMGRVLIRLSAYYAQVQREKGCLRFLAHGVRVLNDMTPQDTVLALLDGDEIDVFEQTLGGRSDLD
ncbi:uncharacterized protein MYCFIDRAFT_206826 [Pseudocercospora fijiensis CIRAD86]|uniref:Rad60/SUMO-like domain-containing protein n=1 Tax=Pseudocercospora fijiensis (strain CIRAD86) TaxID=383855 RepID=M2Z9F6_PSEFD|nr:uncharacterized protein MYCFIDRAFT_206826 [Pseudocercospora fijiensis CIRAD86]EME86460.1 hypothetical protein MYCFIDRAFT_206826 [Pseudocercospora fijiensis CIRAD86]